VARRRRAKPRRRAAKPPRHPTRPAKRTTTGHARAARSPVAHGPPSGRRRALSGRSTSEVTRLGAALAAELDVIRGLERLLTAARQVTRAEAGTVYVRRGEVLEFAVVQNDVLARRVGEEEVRRRVGARPLPLRENSIASYVMLTRSTVNLRDTYEIPVDKPYTLFREVDRKADYRTRSMLALPLRDGRRRVFGVLQLINAIDGRGAVRPFSRDEQKLVQELAEQTTHLPGLTKS
jgi:GAF domain-containing protein